MNSTLRRVNPAISAIAIAISLLALVAAAAGAGYAAGQIGSSQIANNAITAKKIAKNAVTTKKIKKNAVTGKQVKDGSLSVGDLPAEEKYKPATLSNGGEGDCVWQNADSEIPGLGLPQFRKDRDGLVHLSGVALVSDGPGGDGNCDPNDPGQASDAIAFLLPAGYIPFKNEVVGGGSTGAIVVGPAGLTLPTGTLPPGAVMSLSAGVILDGGLFEPAGSPTTAKVAAPRAGTAHPDRFLALLR